MVKDELEQALYRDFPELFREHTLSSYESCMCDGCCCSDHWEPAIRHACKAIMDYHATRAADLPEIPAIQQVKEKFGGLRMYIHGGDDPEFQDVIHKAVNEAEKIAYNTCARCGAGEAKTRNMRGWIVTECDTCFKATDEKDKGEG